MPRRNLAAAPIAVGTPTTAKSHKRQLSAGTSAASTPASRSSKRIKQSAENKPIEGKTTPKKSKYFEAPGSEDGNDEEDTAESTSEEVEGSGYEDRDASSIEPSLSEAESEDDYDSEEEKKRKKKRGRKGNTSKGSGGLGATLLNAGKELWRQGVKAGLGPGKQVFIEKPKPRGDQGIKHVPDRIHPNTMAFLADLKKNNDREWLKMHDPDYRQSWKDWESFVDTLTEKISAVDETIPELPPKDLVFRIYRDVRFSSDPTPYKTHFSAAWSRTGRKGPYACYYVQIQPGGKSFVGSGLWMPEAQPLALLRAEIDRKPEKIRKVLTDAGVRKHIFGGISNDPKKAIKAFAGQNAENALKTKPKGYEADHANVELLRLRNFTIGTKMTDEDVLGPHGLDRIMTLVETMHPFVTYLNSVVMPDEDASSSSGSEAENETDADAQT